MVLTIPKLQDVLLIDFLNIPILSLADYKMVIVIL